MWDKYKVPLTKDCETTSLIARLSRGHIDQISGSSRWLLGTKIQVLDDCDEFEWNSETNACSYYSVSRSLIYFHRANITSFTWYAFALILHSLLNFEYINTIGKIMISFPRQVQSRSTCSLGVNNATRYDMLTKRTLIKYADIENACLGKKIACPH